MSQKYLYCSASSTVDSPHKIIMINYFPIFNSITNIDCTLYVQSLKGSTNANNKWKNSIVDFRWIILVSKLYLFEIYSRYQTQEPPALYKFEMYETSKTQCLTYKTDFTPKPKLNPNPKAGTSKTESSTAEFFFFSYRKVVHHCLLVLTVKLHSLNSEMFTDMLYFSNM